MVGTGETSISFWLFGVPAGSLDGGAVKGSTTFARPAVDRGTPPRAHASTAQSAAVEPAPMPPP